MVYPNMLSMTAKMRPAFYRLHATTLDPAARVEELADALRAADAVQDRHRLAEGAVYASACRRYLLDTGRPWKQSRAADAIWVESDHRFRVRTVDGHITAQCSCGARETVTDDLAATAWHDQHVDATAP